MGAGLRAGTKHFTCLGTSSLLDSWSLPGGPRRASALCARSLSGLKARPPAQPPQDDARRDDDCDAQDHSRLELHGPLGRALLLARRLLSALLVEQGPALAQLLAREDLLVGVQTEATCSSKSLEQQLQQRGTPNLITGQEQQRERE